MFAVDFCSCSRSLCLCSKANDINCSRHYFFFFIFCRFADKMFCIFNACRAQLIPSFLFCFRFFLLLENSIVFTVVHIENAPLIVYKTWQLIDNSNRLRTDDQRSTNSDLNSLSIIFNKPIFMWRWHRLSTDDDQLTTFNWTTTKSIFDVCANIFLSRFWSSPTMRSMTAGVSFNRLYQYRKTTKKWKSLATFKC